MRILGSAVIGLLYAAAASGICLAQAQSNHSQTASPTKKWVQLNGAADLEQLRVTNFNHYLRARRILAAANQLCQPGPPQTYPARFAGDYPDCRTLMWMTSNPPKKLLSFHLDDVGYLALVSVTISGGKFVDGPLRAQPPRP